MTSVRAFTGNWDRARPVEGAYAALLSFANGTFASLTYSGYAHFDGDALCGDISELGARKDPRSFGTARARLAQYTDAEARGRPRANVIMAAPGKYPPPMFPMQILCISISVLWLFLANMPICVRCPTA